MRKQSLVVGLGQFGMALARTLSARGAEVLAVDTDEERVRVASGFAASAVAFDATEESALAQARPEDRDVCVCAIGDESKEASIICTALLRQLGAKHIVSRATDSLHERILRLVGAHEVVNPERAFGERFATRLLYARVLDEVPLGEDLVITELVAPPAFVGRTLVDLALPKRFRLTLVAVRSADSLNLPSPSDPLREGDVLVVVAPPGAVAELMERV